MELTVDGAKVYAYCAGHKLDPRLPTIVFVHGAAHDHSVWSLQSRYFAFHSNNVLALDLPGHGRSLGEPLADIAAMAQWVMRVLDATGTEQAALVGHSMGSLVALEAAARHPGRVRKLALLGISLPMPVSDVFLEAARQDERRAFVMHNVWGHGGQVQIGGDPVPGMWMLGGALRLLQRTHPGVLYTDLRACNGYADGIASAATIRCPTLLVLGKRDLMTPPHAAREVERLISGSRAVWLDACGHAIMAEQPGAVLDALIAFL